MIQRIQTLYLLLVVILGTLLCIFSPVEFLLPDATDYVSLHALDKWPLAVMSIAIPLLALVTIGMYKRRLLQVRLNIMNVVLCLGYYALLALYVAYIVKGYEPLGVRSFADRIKRINLLRPQRTHWYVPTQRGQYG